VPAEKVENDKNPFFKTEDFNGVELKLNGVNSTSSMRFADGVLQVTQILENGLWLEMPLRSCSMGHSIMLEVWGKKFSKKLDVCIENKIQIQGVVEEIDLDGNLSERKMQSVKIRFKNYSIGSWKELLDFFQEKQMNINLLIKKTRK